MKRLFKDILTIVILALLIHFIIRFGGVILELFRPSVVYFIFGKEIGNVILGI